MRDALIADKADGADHGDEAYENLPTGAVIMHEFLHSVFS